MQYSSELDYGRIHNHSAIHNNFDSKYKPQDFCTDFPLSSNCELTRENSLVEPCSFVPMYKNRSSMDNGDYNFYYCSDASNELSVLSPNRARTNTFVDKYSPEERWFSSCRQAGARHAHHICTKYDSSLLKPDVSCDQSFTGESKCNYEHSLNISSSLTEYRNNVGTNAYTDSCNSNGHLHYVDEVGISQNQFHWNNLLTYNSSNCWEAIETIPFEQNNVNSTPNVQTSSKLDRARPYSCNISCLNSSSCFSLRKNNSATIDKVQKLPKEAKNEEASTSQDLTNGSFPAFETDDSDPFSFLSSSFSQDNTSDHYKAAQVPHTQANKRLSQSSVSSLSDAGSYNEYTSYDDTSSIPPNSVSNLDSIPLKDHQQVTTLNRDRPLVDDLYDSLTDAYEQPYSAIKTILVGTKQKQPSVTYTCSNMMQMKGLRSKAKPVEDRPFTCSAPNCTKKFVRIDELNRHSRIHSGYRPFVCSTCLKRFLRSDHLKTHIRTHTGEKPYKCPVCSKRFSRRDGCERHKKIHYKLKARKPRKGSSTKRNF